MSESHCLAACPNRLVLRSHQGLLLTKRRHADKQWIGHGNGLWKALPWKWCLNTTHCPENPTRTVASGLAWSANPERWGLYREPRCRGYGGLLCGVENQAAVCGVSVTSKPRVSSRLTRCLAWRAGLRWSK